MSKNEIWRPVVGHSDYEVSDHGSVRSLTRTKTYLREGVTIRRVHKGRVLRPGALKSGHLVVALRPHGTRLVHHLVLEAFVGPRPDGHESLHGDGKPANNTLGNLKWGTRSENVMDAIRHGTFLLGERHPDARLRAIDIPVIRARLITESCSVIAESYGMSRGAIQGIRDRKSWKSVPA